MNQCDNIFNITVINEYSNTSFDPIVSEHVTGSEVDFSDEGIIPSPLNYRGKWLNTTVSYLIVIGIVAILNKFSYRVVINSLD